MRVRLGTAADAGGVLAIYGPIVETTAISFEVVVPSPDEVAARIVGRQPAHPWLIADDGGVAGYAYAGPFAGRAAYRWSVETSVYVAERSRGRGVGTALYAALLELLAVQGYRRALAGIALPNPGSVALHEGVGFTPAGAYRDVGWKLGAWHDVGWWERPLGPTTAPGRPGGEGATAPPPPSPLTDLPAEVLDAALALGAR